MVTFVTVTKSLYLHNEQTTHFQGVVNFYFFRPLFALGERTDEKRKFNRYC
ncbi:hypothetical protein D3C87_91740 [compost metagenome]